MRLNKELAQRILGDIEEGRRFFCSDGKIFSNLEDLRRDIGEMSDEVFFVMSRKEEMIFRTGFVNVSEMFGWLMG